jgi:hypothetical protein
MMMEIAKQLGPNVPVIGWDDEYAVYPFGNEWTATWDGSSPTAAIKQTAPGPKYTGKLSVGDRMVFTPAY